MMSTEVDRNVRELAAACLATPGLAGVLRALMMALRDAGGSADLDAALGMIDPASYGDAGLVGDVAQYLKDTNRPDLAHRWQKRLETLSGGAIRPQPTSVPRVAAIVSTPKPAEPAAPDKPSPWGEVLSLDKARAQSGEQVPRRRPKVGLDDVAGLADVKDQIRRRIIQPFQATGLYAKFNRKAGGGVLMYGPPGCGKTMLARATAEEVGANFVPVEISEILSRYVGDSEKRMKQIFENARRQSPSILFFDEVEALARKRSFAESNVDSMVSVFLSEFDGLAGNNDGVLVLAATNVPWSVDPAFRRPGRFDRTLFVPPPDREARLAILTKAIQPLPAVPNMDMRHIAEATSGFSGADLAELVSTASDFAIDDSLRANQLQPITLDHMKRARAETRATTLEWLTTARNYAEYANRDGAWDDLAAFLRQHG